MTREELAAIGLAAYGRQWQSALARAIGISARHMRRLASGEKPISEGIAADIRRVLGAEEAGDPAWPRDEWIVGDGPPRGGGQRREYVVHARHPRFIARVVAIDDDGLVADGEGEADVTRGVSYSGDGYVLAEIVWIDPPPPAAELRALLEAACDAVDGSA
jgi:hypothetical protein